MMELKICPIAVVMAYLHLCGPAPGPLFLRKDGQSLKSTLVTGFFSGHSFRIGAETTAIQQLSQII